MLLLYKKLAVSINGVKKMNLKKGFHVEVTKISSEVAKERVLWN